DGVAPDRRIATDAHVADDLRRIMDIGRFADGREGFKIGAERHIGRVNSRCCNGAKLVRKVIHSPRASSLAITAGRFCGERMRSCLLMLNRPNTTVMAEGETANSAARKRTM